jgi:hypothetical protein
MVINFVITVGLSRFFPKPYPKIQNMVDSVREPEGVGPAIDIEAAPEH